MSEKLKASFQEARAELQFQAVFVMPVDKQVIPRTIWPVILPTPQLVILQQQIKTRAHKVNDSNEEGYKECNLSAN